MDLRRTKRGDLQRVRLKIFDVRATFQSCKRKHVGLRH